MNLVTEVKIEGDLDLPTTSNREETESPALPDIDSIPQEPKKHRTLPRNICPTICSVCGDTATGYHYEVASCNGCKTFFRRAVLGQKKYFCVKGWGCFKNKPKEQRNNCRGCRFKKCVDVGMNPLAIITEADLGENKMVQSIVRKRSKSTSQEPENKVIPKNLIIVDQDMSRLIDGLLYLEVKKDVLRKSAYNPDPLSMPTLRELLRSSNSLSLGEKLGPMPNWPLQLPKHPPPPPRFGTERPKLPFNMKLWFQFDLLVCLEYAKTFPFFHLLSEEDQLVLVKYVTAVCSTLMQAFFSYENKSDEILHPDGTNLPPPRPHDAPLRRMKRQSIDILIRYQITRKEYVLLKAILLCNSGISDLSDNARNILNQEKQRHSKALFNLCMAEGASGSARFAAILSIVDTVEYLTRQQKDWFLVIRISAPHPPPKLFEELMD